MGGVKIYWMGILKRDVGAMDVKSHCQQRQGTAREKPGEYSGDDDSGKKRNLDPANPSISAPLIIPSCGMVLPIIVPAQAGDRNQRTKRRARVHQGCA